MNDQMEDEEAGQRPRITINLAHHQAEALKIRWSDPEIKWGALMLGVLLAGLVAAILIIRSAA